MVDSSPRIDEASKSRFGEPAKFLPVVFICVNIGLLWYVYMVYHCIPMWANPETAHLGRTQALWFNIVAAMLVICYVKCILTHPGSIPDKEQAGESSWEYVPQDQSGFDLGRSGSQETKRSGDRRHCKWCAKYKPDRCHHCRVCRTCVLRMDHHCPWIYNCVGFHNHKFFFLLLFYSAIACHIIIWTLANTLKASISPETPFLAMFLVLFGETLACFLGFMVTVFFCFHIWLMLKAMTTIEFCEKSMKKAGYDTNAYDRGIYGNIRAVLGEHPLLWLLPCSSPIGDGLSFGNEEAPLLRMASKDVEAGRDIRKKSHENVAHKARTKSGAGTGECADSDGSGQEQSDSSGSLKTSRQ
jgi:hypothetical protein